MFECDKVVVLRESMQDPVPEVLVSVYIGDGKTQLEMKMEDFVKQVKKELIFPSPFINKAVQKVLGKLRESAQEAVN